MISNYWKIFCLTLLKLLGSTARSTPLTLCLSLLSPCTLQKVQKKIVNHNNKTTISRTILYTEWLNKFQRILKRNMNKQWKSWLNKRANRSSLILRLDLSKRTQNLKRNRELTQLARRKTSRRLKLERKRIEKIENQAPVLIAQAEVLLPALLRHQILVKREEGDKRTERREILTKRLANRADGQDQSQNQETTRAEGTRRIQDTTTSMILVGIRVWTVSHPTMTRETGAGQKNEATIEAEAGTTRVAVDDMIL